MTLAVSRLIQFSSINFTRHLCTRSYAAQRS